MFDLIHKHKLLTQIILGLITLPFAFWGIDSYQRGESTAQDMAAVDGQKITLQDFAQAQRDQQQQLRAILGRNFDPALLNTPARRAELLDQLIQQRLLALQADKSNLVVTNGQLREIIAGMPAFQEDGHFSMSRYKALLRAQDMSEVGFEARLRQDIQLQQLNGAVSDSSLLSKEQVARMLAIEGQQREVSEALLSYEKFAGEVKLAPDAVKTYYDSHPSEFVVPEQVRAEFVVLNPDALAAMVKVSEADERSWYDSNVLPKVEERAAAEKKAEDVLAQVRAAPDKFAELAKKYSQDPGSKDKGGDLGYFKRGDMVKPFVDAVSKMKVGQISGLVDSSFGFHIIKLTGIKPAKDGEPEEWRASHILIKAPPAAGDFNSMRADIEKQLQQQRLGGKYAEAAENFSDLAYEQPDSLQPIVDKFKVKLQQTGWITRKPNAADGVLNNQKILDALFSSDSIKSKHNTEAVETAPGTMVAARVIEHKPATVKPLDEVKAEIAKKLTEQEAMALAVKRGEADYAELQQGKDAGLAWSAPKTVARQGKPAVEPDALKAIFRADTSKLPAYVGVELPGRGYGIYRISRVTEAPVDAAREKTLREQLVQQAAQQDVIAYLANLRAAAKIKINRANLEKSGE
ncbi:MAG TPA: SurA N-terminal domain-containing protein [Burkholderiales bacterium]|nr:SurA N-terminal domain-containing protein [Burkholderiales bacterium]